MVRDPLKGNSNQIGNFIPDGNTGETKLILIVIYSKLSPLYRSKNSKGKSKKVLFGLSFKTFFQTQTRQLFQVVF